MTFQRMQADDIDAVLAIEQTVFPYPWSRANFLDSLVQGYDAWVLRDESGRLLGYLLLMDILDEVHLLNIAVCRDMQGQGRGRMLMDKVIDLARSRDAVRILLEVRPSNTRALAVYAHYGFTQIGCRKGYYPAGSAGREDALVMSLAL